MFHESIDAIGISGRAQFAGESSKHHRTRQRRFQSRAAGFPVRWDFVGVSLCLINVPKLEFEEK